MKELKIVVPNNFREFGKKVDLHIKELRGGKDDSFIVKADFIRFNNGEGKVVINETLRDKDLYILSDVSNHGVSYQYYGNTHYMSPDEHFKDIKSILAAECGHAAKRTVIMPYLYGCRQDKKETREPLDCAIALQELERLRVNEIVTCDVHNRAVMNAVPTMAFESMPVNDVLMLDLLSHEEIDDFTNVIFVSPDEGAIKRSRLYSDLLGESDFAFFHKHRDPLNIVDGHNPVDEHRFSGSREDISGKCVIISDDMIDTGGSIIDAAKKLKKLGASKIYLMATFAFFSKGITKFDECYQDGIINRVYATNLGYVPTEIQNKEWFRLSDCSLKIAELINRLNYGRSVGDLIECKTETAIKIRRLKRINEIK